MTFSSFKVFLIGVLKNPVLCACLLFAYILSQALIIRSPTLYGVIDPSAIAAEQGYAFVTPINAAVSFPFEVYGAGIGLQPTGELRLYEQNFPLRPGNTPLADIRKNGNGAFSHWHQQLYFSSADGSDPRLNGRAYRYSIKARPAGWIINAGRAAGLLALAGLLLAARPPRRRPFQLARSGVWYTAGLFLTVATLALLLVATADDAREAVLFPQEVTDTKGFAFHAPFAPQRVWPLKSVADSLPRLLAESPQLLQDGRSVGILVADPEHVAQYGAGRFTFLADQIYFSTPDGSDPREDLHTYSVRTFGELRLSATLLLLLLGIGGIACLAIGRYSPRARVDSELDGTVAQRLSNVSGMLFIPSIAIICIAMLISAWTSGQNGSLTVASYVPVSDALGYYRCAVSTSGFGTLGSPGFGVDWCARRALYPAVLGAMLGIAQWSESLVLIALAGLIGLAVGVLSVVIQKTLGIVTAIATALALLVFASEFAIGSFMTEAFGFPVGCMGIALLLLFASGLRSKSTLLLGLTLMSIAMAVRPGAILVLPLLLLWAVYETRDAKGLGRWILWAACAAALFSGGALQLASVYAFGADAGNTGGNFSTSLYGLSTGTRDWSQAYRDYKALFETQSEGHVFAVVQKAAIANIVREPLVFVGALWEAEKLYLQTLFSFGLPSFASKSLTVLFGIGLVTATWLWKRPVALLLLSFAIGEMASAPFVIDSGGHRVLAATVGARLTIALLCIAVAADYLTGRGWLSMNAYEPRSSLLGVSRVGTGIGFLLVFLVLIPLSPARDLFRKTALLQSNACATTEREIVVKSSEDLLVAGIGDPGLPWQHRPLGLSEGRLEQVSGSQGAWWMKELPPLPAGSALIYAVQRNGDETGLVVPIYSPRPLPEVSPNAVWSLCLDKRPSNVRLGDFFFWPLERVVVHGSQ